MRHVHLKKQSLMLIALIPLFYFSSYYLISLYTYGDQVHYRSFYDALSMASYSDVMRLGRGYVSSGEPIANYVLWLGAYAGISKDVYIALLNTAMLSFLFVFLKSKNAHSLVVFLIMTNFYTIVLLTGAERLKIAYLMLLLCGLSAGWLRKFLFLISPAAHMQSIILVVGVLSYKFSSQLAASLLLLKLSKRALLVFPILALVLLFFYNFNIYGSFFIKLENYISDGFLISQVFQLAVISLVSFPLVKDRLGFSVFFVVFCLVVLAVGGTRVNMIAFTVIAYVLLEEGKLSVLRWKNLPFISVLMYLSYKSVDFVSKIYLYGNGFASG
jgi:hypothetical protein